MTRPTLPTDLIRAVAELDADCIATRLDELEAEARALRVLLRSARARDNACRHRLHCSEEAQNDALG
jgi:hypothetical protein